MVKNDGFQYAENVCPQADAHGNPFRYCGYCGWMEIPEGKFEALPFQASGRPATPAYVFDLIRTLKANAPLTVPLDFQGHEVPIDVAEELQKAWGDSKAPSTPGPHYCIINAERDPFAHREQYLVGCQCHMGNHQLTWQPGDEPFKCPGGTVVIDPRALIPQGEAKS